MDGIWTLFSRRRTPIRRSRQQPARRLQLEILEDRIAPAAHIGNVTYNTIQAAINAANTGAVITVDPGSYNESVVVNKAITLEGAQHGVAGQSSSRGGNPASESVVGTGQYAFDVMVSGVTIDGFTISGANNQAGGGYGVFINSGVSGTHVVNNIIQNNIVGLGLANAGVSQALVQNNLFRTNNNAGPASGTAIYSDQATAGALSNVLINQNVFIGNNNAGIALNSNNPSQGSSNITITNNTFDSNGQHVYLYNTSNAMIAGNSFLNAISSGGSSSLGLYGNDTNISILDNLFQSGNAFGIRIGNFRTGPNSNIALNGNSISGFSTGLLLDPGGYIGTLNGSGNYWGAATGPSSPNNPGGSGAALNDPGNQVAFAPWLGSGANGVANGQAGFSGDQGSLTSGNPPPPTGEPSNNGGSTSGPATVAQVQQWILSQLTLAQQFLNIGLEQVQQQLTTWFSLAMQQSSNDAVNLLVDQVALTTASITIVQDQFLGKQDPDLLDRVAQLQTAIANNPLSSTFAGRVVSLLTPPWLVATLLQQ